MAVEHERYMRRCFQMASLGAGSVSPNPLVGSVLVYENKIIAEGWHKKFGGPHAEVEVLSLVNDSEVLKKSTLYVNLEPCSHTGKTPPCTELIISKGVGSVAISIRDPFPAVNGSGVAALKKAGIRVTENILSEEGSWLNRRFITFHKLHRPYITLKWAETADGFVAPDPNSKNSGIYWISNSASRLLVHFQRSHEDGILAGNKTIASDNPFLNVRGISGHDPVKIIIDPQLKLDLKLNVFKSPTKTYIVNAIKSGEDQNLTYVKFRNLNNLLSELVEFLFKEQIQSVLVEGGAFTISEFINHGIWDEAQVFRSSSLLESGITAPVTGTPVISRYKIGSDTLSIHLNNTVA